MKAKKNMYAYKSNLKSIHCVYLTIAMETISNFIFFKNVSASWRLPDVLPFFFNDLERDKTTGLKI